MYQNPTAVVIYPGVDASAAAYLNPTNGAAFPKVPTPGNIHQPFVKTFTTTVQNATYNIATDDTVFETIEFINRATGIGGVTYGTYTIWVLDTADYAAPGAYVPIKVIAPGDPPWSWDAQTDQRWNGRSFQISSDTNEANSLQIIYS
jgi:hypothetical protein